MDTLSHADIALNNVSGAGSLFVTGSGIFSPSAITMSGPLSIQGASVVSLNNGNLGSITSVSIASGAILSVNPPSPATLTQPISHSGIISAANNTTFSGTITLPSGAKGRVNANANETVTLSGRIQGAGKLATMGAGTVRLSGTLANTFTGGLEHGGTLLMLSKSAGVTALPGPVQGTGNGEIRWLNPNQVADTAVITAVKTLNLNALNDTVAGIVQTDGTITTGAGALTLTGDYTALAGTTGSTISGHLAFAAGASAIINVANGAASDDLTVSAILSAPAGTVVTRSGSGGVRFTGANTLPELRLDDGESVWISTSPGTLIRLNGGTLSGTGTISQAIAAAGGGVIAPGASIGILNSSSVQLNAATTVRMEINGTSPGPGYDQLKIIGATPLNGASLDLVLTFNPVMGQSFTLISSSGPGVTTPFANLPEGTHFYLNGHIFRITYTGGSGGDTVITKVAPPLPVVTSFSVVPGTGVEAGQNVVNMTITGSQGLNYFLESSSDLQTWDILQTVAAGPSGSVTFRALKPAGEPRVFLRGRQQ
jgi:hypothetical protein